jgi:hypothetical protein
MAVLNVEENDIVLLKHARPNYTGISFLCVLKYEEKSHLCICIMYQIITVIPFQSPFFKDLISFEIQNCYDAFAFESCFDYIVS